MNSENDRYRALLAAIVDSSDDAIISKDLNGVITSWNRAAEEMFGYTEKECIGQPVTMLIPAEHIDEEPKILERIRRGEQIRHYHTLRRAKNGTLLDVSLTLSPVVDSGGKIIGASTIARNIGRERGALEELRQSEERFRVTLGSIGDAVIATDAKARVRFMNPVAVKLTGWGSEAIGMPLDEVFKIVNEYTRNPVESPATKVLREGNVVGLANHTVLISKNGAEVPIDDSGAPIRSEGTDIRGVVLVFRDVTERRAAEIAALRLASIVQNSDDAIISKNLSGIITTWNEGAERTFGYKSNEVVGKSILLLIPPELHQEESTILDRLRRGERLYHFETTRIAKGGQLISVSLTISPIKDHEGRIVGVSKIARDITERKKAEALMAQAREKLQSHAELLEKEVRERTATLEKTVAELEAFSYSLSHDMRAPLRTINSFTEIVLNEHGNQMDEEGREFLKKVIAAARRMDKLILDLLAFTRISRSPVKVEPIDVEPLLRGIVQDRVEFQAPAAEITIESPLAPVLGNEASLTQSFSNLLDNAVKFVEPGVTPRVRIRSEPNGSTVRLWFEDNGIGVDEEGKQRLFQIFERIHSGDYPGFGLGLAIVRKAMERMGGQVGVDSEPGKGSRFWMQLPGVKK